jgi:hypothetical protein
MSQSSRHSIAVLLLGALLVFGCGGTPEVVEETAEAEFSQTTDLAIDAEGTIVGIRINETERELPGLFEEWRSLGINTVFASEELAASGGFRALARKNGADLFIFFPVFIAPKDFGEATDPLAVTSDGERAKEGRVEIACPTRACLRDRRIEEARAIVKRLRPDGISFELIRHFVFWEMVGPDRDPSTVPDSCYCVSCLQGFASFLGVSAFSIPPQPQRAAAWIETNAADRWVRFKAETITSMAEEIAEAVRDVDPDIIIDLHIVPWRRSDDDGALALIAGQDPPALSRVADYLSPMTSSFMLERSPDWLASVVKDLSHVADCPVLPSIHLATSYRENVIFTAAEFEAALRSALEAPSAGVILQSWDQIEADPEKAEIVRRVVRGEP